MTSFPDPLHENWDTQHVPEQPDHWNIQQESSRPDAEPLPQQPSAPPDPAAYMHAAPDPYHGPSSVPLYPSGPTTPPAPPQSPVSGSFPMLYPNTLEKRGLRAFSASTMGALVGLLVGMLVIVGLGVALIRGGVLPFGTRSTGITTIVNTGSSSDKGQTPAPGTTPLPSGATAPPGATIPPGTTPPSGATVPPGTTVTPGATQPVINPSPNPSATLTPQPTTPDQPTPTSTATTAPTQTPTPVTVTFTSWGAQDHQSAYFSVATAPDARLAISAVDCDGMTDGGAPKSGTADGSGNYSAQWTPRKPGGGCRTVTVTVRATLGAQSGTASQVIALGG